jgi:hypothetical protein
MAEGQLVSVFIAQAAGVSGRANSEICQDHKTHKMSRFMNETNFKMFHVSSITHLRLFLLRTVSAVFLTTISFTRKKKCFFSDYLTICGAR